MSTYLLDTHIVLWWLSDDKNLSSKIKDLIAAPENCIMLSVVSIWEMMIKKSLNKLIIPDNIVEILEENNIQILSMTVDHVLLLDDLPLIHNDPFDRLLISQCMAENLIFVTVDPIIMKYQIKCWQ